MNKACLARRKLLFQTGRKGRTPINDASPREYGCAILPDTSTVARLLSLQGAGGPAWGSVSNFCNQLQATVAR